MAAPIACLTIVGIGLGLSIPLLTLEMELMGISGHMIGLNTAMPALAALIFAPHVPRFAGLFGTANLLLALLLVCAGSFTLFLLPMHFWLWFPLRFVFGASIYCIFVVSEYWINSAIEDHRRAFVLGIYATILALGFALGPLILTAASPGTPIPYLIGVAIFVVGAIPILIWRGMAPKIAADHHGGIFKYLFASPTSALAAFTFGALETGAFSLLAVYTLRHGYDAAEAAGCVASLALGGVFFQIPLGYIADRIDRRLMLVFCAFTGLVGAALLPFLINTSLLMPMLVIWGGIVVGMYTIGLAHLGARFKGDDLLSANSLFIFLYALGSLISPVLIGSGMDIWDPQGYVGVTIAFIVLFLTVSIIRWLRQPAIWQGGKTHDSA